MMDFATNTKAGRILNAALLCFKQYGFKRTSMDDIAKAADMSRAALYLLYKNKTDIFRSLSLAFHEKTLGNATTAFDTEGSLQTRITKAVTARMAPLYMLAHDSLHGPELFDVNQSISADINADADTRFLHMLTQALQNGFDAQDITTTTDDLAARELAQLVMAGATGLKTYAFSAQDYETLLTKSIGTLFQGLAPK
jgi:AcrR family transcriptional regulator